MLTNLKWLAEGENFPPMVERPRITRYAQNEMLFDGDHFESDPFRHRNTEGRESIALYQRCAERISKVVGNFNDVISFPVLLNYQRLMSLKMADLICGEYPSITATKDQENAILRASRDYSDFDASLFQTVIDISRYGDAIWRTYHDDEDRKTFTVWDPKEWYPIVTQDGTLRTWCHCLCWRENRAIDPTQDAPDWYLHVQLHWNTKNPLPGDNNQTHKIGKYEQRLYKLDSDGTRILKQIEAFTEDTDLDMCAVTHIRAFKVTNTVYGYDDYMTIDSVLAEIMTRIGQISAILDKHADPNITGPSTMLAQNPQTGEYYLRPGKFFATSVGENEPKYMTWDGQLSAAFKQLEILINQLYIISEMGAAVLGGQDGSSQAISGYAMRYKMVNPLSKARRVSNSLTLPVRKLFSELSSTAEVDEAPDSSPSADVSGATGSTIPVSKISIMWQDGLPDDPRENIEICKLATGETKMMPLKVGIKEYFGKSDKEADDWIEQLDDEAQKVMDRQLQQQQQQPNNDDNPNRPGPQDGTGVNPKKNGSSTGLNRFKGTTSE